MVGMLVSDRLIGKYIFEDTFVHECSELIHWVVERMESTSVNPSGLEKTYKFRLPYHA